MRVKVLIPWLFWYVVTSPIKASIHSRFLQRSSSIGPHPWWHFHQHKMSLKQTSCFPAGSFNSPSVASEFTRPVLREQICVYTHSMTFNNNNNRRCLDLLAAMATGIRQRQLLCWWCPQKNRGANWQRLWDRAVFQHCSGHLCSVGFHKKGQTRLLLLAQSLCEINRRFVYSAPKEAASERDVCLWFRP